MAYGPNKQILDAGEARGRNTNAIMADWVDRGPWQYWDTVTANPNTQIQPTYGVFTVPIGAQNPLPPGGQKSKLLTNMTKGGEFPPPRCLLLMALCTYFSSRMSKVDIDNWMDSCWYEFVIDSKVFHEGQPWVFPGGAGLMGVSTQSGQSVLTNGFPTPEATRRYMDWSKYIAPLQQFVLNIYVPGTPFTTSADGIGLYIPIYGDGLTDRSVQ